MKLSDEYVPSWINKQSGKMFNYVRCAHFITNKIISVIIFYVFVTAVVTESIMSDQGQVGCYVIVVAKARGQYVRDRLTKKGIFDSNRKMRETATGKDLYQV